MKISKTSSGADSVLHHPPEAFDGVEVMPTMGREEMEAQLTVVVVECRVELVSLMDTAAIDDHHDLFAGFAEDRHHLMKILAQLLGIKVWHDFIEDFGRPVLDRPDDAEQHPAGDPAPGARASPHLAFEGFVAFDLTLAQGPGGEARALGAAPPARSGQGKAPQDGFILIQQNDVALARAILQGSEFDRAIGQVGWVRSEPPGGTAVT